ECVESTQRPPSALGPATRASADNGNCQLLSCAEKPRAGPNSMRFRTECATSSCCSSERAFHQSRNSSVNSTSHATPIVCHIQNISPETKRHDLGSGPLGCNVNDPSKCSSARAN